MDELAAAAAAKKAELEAKAAERHKNKEAR